MRLIGVPEAEITDAIAVLEGDQSSAVWAENVETVLAFVSLGTQWRFAAIGGGMEPMRRLYLGLDYAGARAGIEMAGIEITPSLWSGVQLMEAEARDALNGSSSR